MNNSPEIKTKVCSKCGINKSLTEFNKKRNGLNSKCKKCEQIYYKLNLKRIKEKQQLYYVKHKETLKEKSRLYNKIHKDRKRECDRRYNKSNRKVINTYRKGRLKTDSNYKIRIAISKRFTKMVKKQKTLKSKRTMEMLGCSLEDFKKHIELQFKEGMTWENHTFKGWHLDHIKPCASFDLTNPKQQEECFHYSNFQPLWWYENLSKGDKIV